jgi:homoserine dehydrogenase
MISDDQIKSIATANGTSVSYVSSKPTKDLDGNDALQITIILTSESSAAAMPPDAALKTLVQVHDELLQKGDRRFPFISYTTQEDLAKSATDES